MTDDAVIKGIRARASAGRIHFSDHATKERLAEGIEVSDVLEAIENAILLEDCPTHERGACCLIYGTTYAERNIHIVCTSAVPTLIFITVYEPKLPKWITPTQRRNRNA